MRPKAKYLFFDLETTGLDPREGVILEYAAIPVDAELRQVGDPIERVLRFRGSPADGGISEHVYKMHTDNGLWDDCSRSQATAGDLEIDLRGLVEAHDWAEGKPILAGSSIHFDRAWLAWHTSAVDLLHYRMFDVRALVYAREDLTGQIVRDSNPAHRALADAMHALDAARLIYSEITGGRWSR